MKNLHGKGSIRTTDIVVLFALSLLILSLQAISVSANVGQNSADAKLETGAHGESQDAQLLTVGSIQDLFQDYSDDLSRLSAAYDLIGTADEAKLVDLFEQATKEGTPKKTVVGNPSSSR